MNGFFFTSLPFLISHLFFLYPFIALSYYVSVNIDRNGTDPDRTYMITNTRSEELCPPGYTKYIAERPDCFSVSDVKYNNTPIKIKGSDIVLHYVYCIEAYYRSNSPIMIRFIKYHTLYTRVFPAYVVTKSGDWVEESSHYYDRNLSVESLAKILDSVSSSDVDLPTAASNRLAGSSSDDKGPEKREFQLFEDDQLKEKKSGFYFLTFSGYVLFFQIFYSFLSI